MLHDQVKDYYGRVLQSNRDLQTDVCCPPDDIPERARAALAEVHHEVSARYYGCGLVLPPVLEGAAVLDLGCGAGRDCFALSRLVGESGRVVGVDMTEEQLAVARDYVPYHTEAYGYTAPNVAFHHGYIERLEDLDLEPGSFDVIVSNCVLNLSPDKAAVLRGARRLLRPGGEMYFSDVYADRRLPAELAEDPVLHGECLAGALYWNDFLHIARESGFAEPRLAEDRPLTIDNPDLRALLGPARFFSATYRLFALDGLEPSCEDYGQAAVYRGTVDGEPDAFTLDKHHVFPQGKVVPVCGNTYRMLGQSRLAPHFDLLGTWDTHYGIFPGCGELVPFDESSTVGSEESSGGCC